MIFHGGSKQSTSLKLIYHLKMGSWKIIFVGARPVFRGELLVLGTVKPGS